VSLLTEHQRIHGEPFGLGTRWLDQVFSRSYIARVGHAVGHSDTSVK